MLEEKKYSFKELYDLAIETIRNMEIYYTGKFDGDTRILDNMLKKYQDMEKEKQKLKDKLQKHEDDNFNEWYYKKTGKVD